MKGLLKSAVKGLLKCAVKGGCAYRLRSVSTSVTRTCTRLPTSSLPDMSVRGIRLQAIAQTSSKDGVRTASRRGLRGAIRRHSTQYTSGCLADGVLNVKEERFITLYIVGKW